MSSLHISAPEQRADADKGASQPEVPQQGSSGRKWVVIAVLLLAVVAAVWKIRANRAEQEAQSNRMMAMGDRPVPVLVQPVVSKTMPIYLTALGTVTAYNTVTIKSRVDGQLLQVFVREGQAVRKGQLLMQIDPAPYQAALAQAQGNLVKDQANAANAEAEAARYTALYQAGVVSKESQQSQISSAGQASGSIDADKAAIQAARVNVAYTRITSPIDGVVGLRQVDPGNIVHASDTTGLLVVTQVQPITVIFTLPEDQVPQVQQLVRAGKKLTVEAYDRSQSTHLATGTLLTLDNVIDTTTGTVKGKAVFDNRDGALFPNQFVNVRLILEDRPNTLVIPAVALQSGVNGSFVYVMKAGQQAAAQPSAEAAAAPGGASGSASGGHGFNGPTGTVEARSVKVDLTEGAQILLESGLRPGEMIVVDGQEKLKDGAKVIPHQATAPAAPASGAARQPAPADAAAAQRHTAQEKQP
ncbi:MAG: efflux RND transporter periplasmic adaptor subunit [Acidobacteriota bacterium]|nr:efflux RND transporter periplasmic adaptor subunit [Acidobacteriota bacterium]